MYVQRRNVQKGAAKLNTDPFRHDDERASAQSQTDWGLIDIAAHGEKEAAQNAWDEIGRRYWPAIYAYIRSTGRDIHDAADLTQAFVCEVMINRGLVQAASPERGRFRMLLLTAIKNYLAEQHRYAQRQKRKPRLGQTINMTPEALNQINPPEVGGDPDHAFTTQWSAMIVRRVLECVQRDCIEAGMDAHWSIFAARVVEPMLTGADPKPYEHLIEQFGIKNPAQAANMMITVKRRVARALMREVRKTLEYEDDVHDELIALVRDTGEHA